MAKISVALCITDLDIGGAERCLTEIAVRIDRSRFTPVVYCHLVASYVTRLRMASRFC